MEIFFSLLIFLAPYGATDSSPAGCSRLAVGSGWRGPEKREAGWIRKRRQTSSGPACHLRGPAHLRAHRPASHVDKHVRMHTLACQTKNVHLSAVNSVTCRTEVRSQVTFGLCRLRQRCLFPGSHSLAGEAYARVCLPCGRGMDT